MMLNFRVIPLLQDQAPESEQPQKAFIYKQILATKWKENMQQNMNPTKNTYNEVCIHCLI